MEVPCIHVAGPSPGPWEMFSGYPPADKCLGAFAEEAQGSPLPAGGTLGALDGDSEIPFVCPRSLEALPISNHRDKILASVERNRVTCIQGETGCGKSSMVPYFIVCDAVSISAPNLACSVPYRHRVQRRSHRPRSSGKAGCFYVKRLAMAFFLKGKMHPDFD